MKNMKKCSQCGQSKPYSAFSPSKVTKSGCASGCKECLAEAYRKRYAEKEDVRERQKASQKKWLDDPKNYRDKLEWGHKKTEKIRAGIAPKKAKATKEQCRVWRKTARAKNPEKERARAMVQRACRAGKLIRLPCEMCGNEHSEAHHPNYSKPLDVRWLCRIHHRGIERRLPEHRLVIKDSDSQEVGK